MKVAGKYKFAAAFLKKESHVFRDQVTLGEVRNEEQGGRGNEI